MILYRYTDYKHRLTTPKLNEYLKPYELECEYNCLTDTVKVLNDLGCEVSFGGSWKYQGYWWKKHLFEQEQIDKLVFTISSNPYIQKEDAAELLSLLKPLITVYQESTLKAPLKRSLGFKTNNRLYEKYATINKAIHSQRPIKYKSIQTTASDNENTVNATPLIFTPKSIYQTENEFYMFGYSHKYDEIMAINLDNITSVELSYKNKRIYEREGYKQLQYAEPEEYIL